MTNRIPVGVFFALFTVSGFAGLIYESIWSHYLKLFLGHAAYAQTLVLAIFMGGMAIGSWLVSRFTHRIRNLLLGYAMAEAGIGLLAIGFHGVFVSLTDWGFDAVIPALGSPGVVNLFKWALASAMILPASLLLGSTFPLMSAGIMRIYPDDSARTLAWLYFTNSLGASVGVLVSGFYMIARLGLPGTILSAGLLNVALALVVWALTKRLDPVSVPEGQRAAPAAASRLVQGIAAVAFVTGAASFMYEISWIRMLTLGLGASTHAFEVMLSAFILGMAVGGLALAVRAPRPGNEPRWLSVILLSKAFLAVLAIGVYGQVLTWIGWTMSALSHTEAGYTLLNVAGHLSSMAVMFPAAMCAGMTLPLATSLLLSRGNGEASIGRVYAANTAGCIVGAAFSTHIGMEWLGVKGITGFGAALDLGAGAAIALLAAGGARLSWRAVGSVGAVAMAAFLVLDVDQLKMASGVFRSGIFLSPEDWKVEYYKDGKTATISVTSDGRIKAIRTNGKPDAGLQFAPDGKPTWDESTMTLLAALAIAHRPDAQAIANIGFGSGLTTHVLLGADTLKRVDTIEIEPAMVEGARLFERFNKRAYSDPRSFIQIEDAKTYFAANRAKYDVIVSEPSNPWVSGVATLFSDEFYARVRGHLNERGLMMQWMHVYEIDFDLLASVLKALGKNFRDYRIFTTQPGDIFIVASPNGKVPPLSGDIFERPEIRDALARVGYHSMAEIGLDFIASRAVVEPLVNSGRYPVNSDYFPIVDQYAPRARFLRSSAQDFAGIAKQFVPFSALVDPDTRIRLEELGEFRPVASKRLADAYLAAAVADTFLTGRAPRSDVVAPSGRLLAAFARSGLTQCSIDGTVWVDALEDLLRTVTPVLRGEVVDRIFAEIDRSPCYRSLSPFLKDRLALYRAFARRDARAMRELSDRLLAGAPAGSGSPDPNFILAGLSSRVVLGDLAGGRAFWARYSGAMPPNIADQIATRAIVAHLAALPAEEGSKPRPDEPYSRGETVPK